MALLLVAGWRVRWSADDGFIDFRVVDNLLGGAGPVFNLGERVEVYTSPIWIALLAFFGGLARLLPQGALPLEWVAVLLSLSLSGAGLLLASVGSGRLWRLAGRDGWFLPLGSLSVAAIAAFWDFATSGLECGLILAWLGLSFVGLASLATRPNQPRYARLALLLGLGPLVRPDLLIESVVFLAVLFWAVEGWRKRAIALAAAVAAPASYQIFRMGYFAALVPNTALAKEAGLSYWSAGFAYLVDFVRTYRLGLVFPVLAAALFWLGRLAIKNQRCRVVVLAVAPVVAGLVHGLYIVRLGGDFMHARMLLPVFFDLAMPVAVIPAASWREGALAAALLVWAAVSLHSFRTPYKLWASGDALIGNERAIYVMNAKKPNPVTLTDYDPFDWRADGRRVRQLAETPSNAATCPRHAGLTDRWSGPPREVALLPEAQETAIAFRPNIGLFGFGAGPRVFICDSHGLPDPIGSRVRIEKRGKPGHEKSIGLAWCLGRRTVAEQGLDARKDAAARSDPARVALGCRPISELIDAVDQPMTLRRFLKNLALAPRLTFLRIPADPAKAKAELCGT